MDSPPSLVVFGRVLSGTHPWPSIHPSWMYSALSGRFHLGASARTGWICQVGPWHKFRPTWPYSVVAMIFSGRLLAQDPSTRIGRVCQVGSWHKFRPTWTYYGWSRFGQVGSWPRIHPSLIYSVAGACTGGLGCDGSNSVRGLVGDVPHPPWCGRNTPRGP